MTVSATANPAAMVALARDRRTTLVAPGLLVVVGLLLAALGVAFAAVQGPGVTMVALVGLGAALAGLGAWVILRIRSLRLRVEPDYLHLTGLGVDRRYHLAPGSMARVATSGVRRSRRPSGLGSTVGPATLGSGETVELIRLGATPSVILVPTQGGRVALAAAAEGELVQALMGAAQKRAERAPVAPAVAAAVVSDLNVRSASSGCSVSNARAASSGCSSTKWWKIDSRGFMGPNCLCFWRQWS